MDVPLTTTAVELDSRNATVRSRRGCDRQPDRRRDARATRADAAIMNGGGIRAGKVYPPGTAITRRDVLAELPFGNHLVALEVKGSDLAPRIENGLSRLPAAAGRFPQVSGMRVEFDPQRPAGGRVLAITDRRRAARPNKVYRVAINDFMARGGDGYSSFAAIDPLVPLEDTPLLSDEVMIHLRGRGSVQSGVEGRITAR